MSLADASLEELIPSNLPVNHRRFGVAWSWVVIACVLLGTSGLIRTIQERRHQFEKSYKESCPIELTKIPKKFGDWKLIQGGEKYLDPMTMRITGGTDHLIRTYANDLTGVSLTVLILFGPADPVLPHTPQVCYPSSGYSEGDAPMLRTIEYSAGKDAEGRSIGRRADFLAASYMKPAGRTVLREAVYHSFRLDGQWSPYIGSGRKFPRRNPGIFKIQIQRLAAEGESLTQGDPIEQFLASFVPGIESEIKAAADKAPAAN
jgi:hypothetical protein